MSILVTAHASGTRLGQRGFTLLEAIVAMVLISSTGITLFAWVNSSITALNHIHDANARSEATVNALEYLDRVNPMLTPEGRASLGSYQVRWRAKPVTLIQDGVNYPQGLGLYQFALYETRVLLENSSGQAWFDFNIRQIGYKKVRTLQLLQ